MSFQIGDKVIHWNHGLGEITRIEEMMVHECKTLCYVVNIRDLTIWVPFDEMGQRSLRVPTPGSEFENLFAILHSPDEPLPDDRWERKNLLLKQMKDGQLASMFQLVRDLSGYARKKRLNDDDKQILEHAKNSILTEWAFSLSVPISQARKKMAELLGM